MSESRPDLWIGHISLKTSDLSGSHDFMLKIGLRLDFNNDKISIFELRGGTHLIMIFDAAAEAEEAEFDFMVEDVDATYATFEALDLVMSPIERGDIHDSFVITEPGGNRIKVNSTHVEDHSIV